MGAGFQMGKIQRVLIVAPTSVCAVWPKEFQDYADFKYTVKLLLGTKAQRLKALDDLAAFPFRALKVAVINYESTWRDGVYEKIQEFDPDLIIADESQRIKSHDAQQSKAMHALGDKARYKMVLSGTPVQNNAIDIWSQYRFLDPTIYGTNFWAFRARYAVMGGFNRKQVVGYRDLDQLIKKEHSIAYRVTKEEALDLPEQTFENRYIALEKKERMIYDKLRRDSYAELDGGDHITATTVLTRLLRLQQFTGGFLVADDALRRHSQRKPGQYRARVPGNPGGRRVHRADRHGRNRYNPDRRRHLRLLLGQFQLRHLFTEPRPDPPHRAAEHLHIYPPGSREHHRRDGPKGPE